MTECNRLAEIIDELGIALKHREELGEYNETAKAVTELYGYVLELAALTAARGPSVGEAIKTLVKAKLDGLPEVR